MIKIVVATTNKDKFKLVKDLIQDIGVSDAEYVNLEEFEEYTPKEEFGLIHERAEQKATNFAEWALSNQIDVNIIIGVDDGFSYSDKVRDADSRTLAQLLLSGEQIMPGESVILHRAFSIIRVLDGHKWNVECDIPLIFKGIDGNSLYEEGKYSLRKVLCYEGSDVVISEESDVTIRRKNKELMGAEISIITTECLSTFSESDRELRNTNTPPLLEF